MNTEALLERAVALARKGTGNVEPNPRVGALVIRDGEIVGEGYHPEYGGPHAEIIALSQAGELARGAELFLTLEPCSTLGKTAACTDAIIATGIRKVTFAVADPNPKNGGLARKILEDAGIEVEQLENPGPAEPLISDFRTYLKGTLPWVILKWAMTADGKVATVDGDTRWISGERSREEVHQERRRADAVLIGRVTVKTDDPELTARLGHQNGKQPVRVVLDTGLHLEPSCKVAMTANQVPTWVFHAQGLDDGDRRSALEALGVHVVDVPMGEGGRLDVGSALRKLREHGLHRILVEGGPTVHGSLLTSGFADWVRVYMAPLLVGGITAPGPVAGAGIPRLADGVWLKDVKLRVVGDEEGSDLVMEGRVTNHIES